MRMTDIERRALKHGAPLPDLSELPVRVPRDKAAELVSRYFFEISPRTMERWPIAWRRLNGKAHCETVELFAKAEAMLGAAPAIMGGRSPDAQEAAA